MCGIVRGEKKEEERWLTARFADGVESSIECLQLVCKQTEICKRDVV